VKFQKSLKSIQFYRVIENIWRWSILRHSVVSNEVINRPLLWLHSTETHSFKCC